MTAVSRIALVLCFSLGFARQSTGFSSTTSTAICSTNRGVMTMSAVPYQRKCPFVLPQDSVKINNMPPIMERVPIRVFHFFQRKLVQWGALKSWNPIVKLLSFIFYAADLVWSSMDKEVRIPAATNVVLIDCQLSFALGYRDLTHLNYQSAEKSY